MSVGILVIKIKNDCKLARTDRREGLTSRPAAVQMRDYGISRRFACKFAGETRKRERLEEDG